jgi:hypothetical protein
VARRVVILILASWGLYLVAANVLLGTHLLRGIIGTHPDKLRLEYRSAYTVWPARVHVSGLDIRGDDDSLQWDLRIEAATVRVSLLALVHKRFHGSHVRVSGVALRIRQKLDPDDVSPETTERLPPIDGFEDPPLVAAVPSPPSRSEPWTVELDDVDAAGVGLVWIDGYRYEGQSRAWGSMVLQPGRVVQVGPTLVAIQSGGVFTGADPVGVELSGILYATIDRHDPRQAPKAQILRYVSAATDLSGALENVRFLDHFWNSPSIVVGGGRGRVESSVRLDHGTIAPGTAIDVVAGAVTASSTTLRTSSDAHGTLSVGVAAPDPPKARIEIRLAGLDVVDSRFVDEPIVTPRASVVATSLDLDLRRPFTDLDVHVEVPEATIEDMRVIDAQIPPHDTFSFDKGSATVRATFDLSVPGDTASGAMTMTSPRLYGHVFKSRLDAQVAVKLRLVRADFRARTFDLAGTSVDLRDVSTTEAPSNDRWWGRFDADELVVHASPPRLHLRVNGRARDGRPLLALFETNASLPTLVHGALELVPNGVLGGKEGFTGSTTLDAARETIDLSGMEIRGGDVHVHGDFHRHGEARSGAILIAVPPLSLGLAFHPGGTTLRPMADEAWLRTHRAGEIL